MKRVFTPILLLLLTSITFAQTKNSVTRSAIKFQIKNLGINTGGTIGGLQANIHFQPENLDSSLIEASVDVNTLDTDNGTRDTHVKSDEFFDAPKYPKITMKSISFKHKSGDSYTGRFNVTIKDKTRQFDVPFTYSDAGSTAIIKGGFKLNRLDFGVGEKSFVLSNDVTVSIELEVAK
jgi:polyisoprenoid-binding protein YceI